jgi:hypothetical protein
VFPVGEGTAVGFLFAMGNFCGFLLGMVLSVIVQGETRGQTAGGLGFCFAVFLVGLLMIFLMKEVKNREISEKAYSDNRNSFLPEFVE